MKRTLAILQFVLCLATPAFALKTVTSVLVSPHGAVVAQGDSLTYTTSCTYSDLTTDACVSGNAGSPTATSFTTCYPMSGLVATWTTGSSCDPDNGSIFPAGPQTAQGYIQICYQSVCDKAAVLAQHVGDTFYPYITPDYRQFQMGPDFANTPLPLNVVVGSQPQLGLGYIYNNSGTGSTGVPGQFTCNWATSDASKATIDRFGAVTAIAAGNVTLTCNPASSTNVVFGNSIISGWTLANGGNGITLTIVNPTATLQTWYVRHDGGSYYDATNSPSGLCDGLSNLPAAGATAHHCAVDNPRNLVWDNARNNNPAHNVWVVGPGDIVNVDDTGGTGYSINSTGSAPTECTSGVECWWPPFPSGTATHHTIIRGTNYASCSTASQMAILFGSGGAKFAFNLNDSQYVDVQCVKLTQQGSCGGIFTYSCSNTGETLQSAVSGFWTSALTSNVTFTDVWADGLVAFGFFGASGYNGLAFNRVRISYMPGGGINMDDAPWVSSNISVAGGMTMANTIVEWSGCSDTKNSSLQYPALECRDSTTNSGWNAPDGIGEGNTSGHWSFDHVIMRYNWQDDFDLLHAGMQYLSITNSQSYGSIGASYKIGPSDTVNIINTQAIVECKRMSSPVGDQPSSSIVAGATYCRGNDWTGFQIAAGGTYNFLFNSWTGYQDTIMDYGCGYGYTASCTPLAAPFMNNTILGYVYTGFNSNQAPGISGGGAVLPIFTHDYNNFYGIRGCFSLGAHETCNTASPAFTTLPSSPMTTGLELDNFNFLPAGGSPLISAGTTTTPPVTTDINGLMRTTPPWIGSVNGSPATTGSVGKMVLKGIFQ